jgi:uncharacterized protein
LVRAACARPTVTVLLSCLVAAVCVLYALHTLTLRTSTRSLLPQNERFVQRYAELDREFGELDDLAIVVAAPDPSEAKAYATRLVQELRRQKVPLRRIAYRVDPKQFEGRALLYLSTERLKEIRDKIFDYQEFMEAFAGRPTLEQLASGVATQVAAGFVTGFFDLGLQDNKAVLDLKFVQDLVAQISERLDRPAPYRSPWSTLFAVGDVDEAGAGYFLSDDERLLFILADPESRSGSFTGERDAIEGVRAVVRSIEADFPRVKVGVTGKPALANDEMTAAFRDSERATVVAFILTLALLLVAFLRVGKPLVMLAILALSLCWSIGLATLAIGHLSLFSVMFISIVIGIGIDYGVYYLFRYEEELFLGRNLKEAIEITAARSGPGMLLGAVTAAGTFYVLMLTDFRGLQELGFIAGSSILLSWLAMITVFPAALVMIDRRHADRPAGTMPRAMALESTRMPMLDQLSRHPRIVLILAAIVTVLSLYGLRWVNFDYNLLNLQAEGTESVAWERKVIATGGRSGFAALSTADSLEELRRKQTAFSKLSTVSEVDSALLLIPDDQEAKQKIIADFAPLIAPVRVGRPVPVDLERLVTAFATLKRRLDIAATEAPAGDVKRKLRGVTADIDALLTKLRRADPDAAEPVLTLLQQQMYRDFVRNFQRLQANANPKPIGIESVPPELRRKFISDQGRFLLQIHPSVDIWERTSAQRFVDQLRSIDHDVTGTPIITHEAIRLMERAYKQGTVYAIILVSGVTFVMLRRVRLSLLALLPLALGLLWTVGLMYIFNLSFNMGNVFGLPLILGAAAEYGLNVVMRFIEGREAGGPLIARSTVMAVLVSGLTTMVGFGSLMLAAHRGIFGLGLLLTIGSASSLIAALVVLPVLLRLLRRRQRASATPVPAADTHAEAHAT